MQLFHNTMSATEQCKKIIILRFRVIILAQFKLLFFLLQTFRISFSHCIFEISVNTFPQKFSNLSNALFLLYICIIYI